MKYVNFHKFYITSFCENLKLCFLQSILFCYSSIIYLLFEQNKYAYSCCCLFHAQSFGLKHETKTQTPKRIIFKLVGTGHSFRISHRCKSGAGKLFLLRARYYFKVYEPQAVSPPPRHNPFKNAKIILSVE